MTPCSATLCSWLLLPLVCRDPRTRKPNNNTRAITYRKHFFLSFYLTSLLHQHTSECANQRLTITMHTFFTDRENLTIFSLTSLFLYTIPNTRYTLQIFYKHDSNPILSLQTSSKLPTNAVTLTQYFFASATMTSIPRRTISNSNLYFLLYKLENERCDYLACKTRTARARGSSLRCNDAPPRRADVVAMQC